MNPTRMRWNAFWEGIAFGLVLGVVIGLILWRPAWGFGYTMNSDRHDITLYLDVNELAGITPQDLKTRFCTQRFQSKVEDGQGVRPPSRMDSSTQVPATCEIYRRTENGLNTLLIAFPLSDCVQ